MISLHPGWFSSAVNPLAHVLIIAAAVWVAWQNRDRRPLAASLFLFTALLSLLDVELRFLEAYYIVMAPPHDWCRWYARHDAPGHVEVFGLAGVPMQPASPLVGLAGLGDPETA